MTDATAWRQACLVLADLHAANYESLANLRACPKGERIRLHDILLRASQILDGQHPGRPLNSERMHTRLISDLEAVLTRLPQPRDQRPPRRSPSAPAIPEPASDTTYWYTAAIWLGDCMRATAYDTAYRTRLSQAQKTRMAGVVAQTLALLRQTPMRPEPRPEDAIRQRLIDDLAGTTPSGITAASSAAAIQ